MKTMRRNTGILAFALMLALALFPQRASADPALGELDIGGILLCADYDADKETGTCTPYTDHSAVYDLAGNTLTLTDYDGGRIYAYSMGSDFRIVLVGDNRAEGIAQIQGNSYICDALDTTQTDVSISGTGSLTCEGIYLDDERTLEISGSARVTSTSNEDELRDWRYGVRTGWLRLKDNSRLTATGGNVLTSGSPSKNGSFGVYAAEGITVTDSAELTAYGGRGVDFSYGIHVYTLEVISGTVEARAGSGRESFGIRMQDHWIMLHGVPVYDGKSSIEISGGGVIAKGDTSGMNKAPDLSGYARYRWKTDSSFVSSDQAPYVWNADHTYTEIAPPASAIYTIIKGQDGVWAKGSSDGLSFTANADYSKFCGCLVDGDALTNKDYTSRSGSTVVTLKASFLETLSSGRHKLRINFTDGYAEANFTVLTEADVPATGDPAAPILWLGVALTAGALLATTAVLRRRLQNE